MTAMQEAIFVSYSAGLITMALAARHAVEYLRRHGREGCVHSGSVICGACGKRTVNVDEHGRLVTKNPSALFCRAPSPKPGVDRYRFGVQLTEEFAAFVDMDAQDAADFVASVQGTLESDADWSSRVNK